MQQVLELDTRLARAQVPVAVLSPDGTVTGANAALALLLGRDAQELVGVGVTALGASPEDAAALAGVARSTASGVGAGQLDVTLRCAHGSDVPVRLTWSSVEDPSRTVVVLHDETPRLHGEQQLRRSDARFRSRFDQSVVPQSILGPDGAVMEVNDACLALLGRPREEVVGRPPAAFTAAADAGLADAELGRVLCGVVPSAQAERCLQRADGAVVPVLVSMNGLRDADGALDGVAVFLHDLTTLRDAEQRRTEQERFFLALSTRATDSALVLDAEGTVVFATGGLAHVLGRGPAELLGTCVGDLVGERDRERALACWQRVLEGQTETIEVSAPGPDGSERCLEITLSDQRGSAVGGLVGNLRDVTDRVLAEQGRRVSEARYRTIAETSEEGVWAVSTGGGVLYANARLAQVLGRPLVELCAPGARDRLLPQAARPASGASVRTEVSYTHPDGSLRLLWVSTSPLLREDGTPEGSLSMVMDVTETRRLEAELRRAALHDALTGLPNRALLLDRLEHALSRETLGTAVLFLDLDHFKLVNDSRGHAAGDQLLQVVADRLLSAVRPGDTVSRFGGDEFVVVCEETDDASARELADDLLATLRRPVRVDGEVLQVRASVGVAVSPAASGEDLLRFADTALYAAKHAGRGRVRMADPALTEQAELRFALAADLRTALLEDRLEVHLQPVVDLHTGRLAGMEALTRWHHPEHGPVPPARFVEVAEQHGMAGQLDRWVADHAFAAVAELHAAGALDPGAYVAINLSARNLADPGLEEHVVECAQEHGLDASQVVLEITEGAVMDEPELARQMLARLRARGFGVALDDFGTGHSSMAYLRDLPVTTLKVDRSFVRGIEQDRDALAIVTSLVELARAVGVGTVAEGVETAGQAALLRKAGCRTGQGWLWSRAVRPDVVRSDPRWRDGFEPASLGVPSVPTATARLAVRSEHGLDVLLALHAQGASPASVAAALNREGRRTPEGTRWHARSVERALSAAMGA